MLSIDNYCFFNVSLANYIPLSILSFTRVIIYDNIKHLSHNYHKLKREFFDIFISLI